MCGIVSLLDPSGGLGEGPLRRALEALRHRGPDGDGLWLSADGRVALGHTRLALIDPSGGAQPIASEDGSIVAAVNGELYGFEAARRRLERRGHRFRTGSDSEIVVHLYEELGPACLDRLRGEFALVLWDGRLRRLLAARDRFGVKPLCYARDGDRLLIASEAKALFALGVRPAWDREAMFQVLSLQYPPPGRTLFDGVATLPPGRYLLADGRGVSEATYWDLDYPAAGAAPPPEGDVPALAGELRRRLEEAVRVRLRADAPLGFHLSGGLDSASVVALAARHLARPPRCFTVTFDAPGYDELAEAREAAEHLGAELVPVPVRRDDLVEHLPEAVAAAEGLAINGHLPAKLLLARAIRREGFKAVLSGEGSDELLGGYAHFRRDLAEAEGAAPAGAEQEGDARLAGMHLAEGASLDLAAVGRALGFVPSFLAAKGTLGARLRGVLAPAFLAEFAGCDPARRFLEPFDVPGRLAGRHRLDQASYLWTKSSLATYILRTLGDGTEMAAGLEGRLPFLDHRLVDFMRRVPPALKIRHGVEKFLLREAMRPLLPEASWRRPKRPFTAPPLSRHSSSALDAMLRDVLGGPRLDATPFFDAAALRRLLDHLPGLPEREQVATDPVLMLALTTCLLQEHFRL